MRLSDVGKLRKLCMALNRQGVASYGDLEKKPIYELMNICRCWKELREEMRGG